MFHIREKEIERNIDAVKLISAIKMNNFCRGNAEDMNFSCPAACSSAQPCNLAIALLIL